MSEATVDNGRRTWLITSAAMGGVGAAAVAVPFVSTFQPSERAKAAGAAVEVDISALQPGQKIVVEWRGKPVWIMKRTPEQLAGLERPVLPRHRLVQQPGQRLGQSPLRGIHRQHDDERIER